MLRTQHMVKYKSSALFDVALETNYCFNLRICRVLVKSKNYLRFYALDIYLSRSFMKY
jgi:hypothetical protein